MTGGELSGSYSLSFSRWLDDNYTVLGDTVNVAARLEQANKRYGTSILISEATVRMMRDDDRLERLEDAHLRGMSDRISVYGLAHLPRPT